MKKSHYESVVIINAALEDDQIEASINRAEVSIKTNGGEIEDTDKWGRKRLAYPINKSKSGFYIIFRFTAPTESIKKIERDLRLDETIIRFLTVALDKRALKHYAEQANQSKTEEVVTESIPAETEKVESEEGKEEVKTSADTQETNE